MEKLRDLVFLLPGYELEGYPRSLPSDEADAFLSGWLAMWHPAILSGAQTAPRWQQTEHLPTELSRTLFVLPGIADSSLDEPARAQIAEAKGLLFVPAGAWREQQSKLLGLLSDGGFELPQTNELAESLRAEFAALGYTYLQIQLMTRLLRYNSNLDQLLFNEQVCQAADAALAGDVDTAKILLQACFDSLGQERDHYYSLDVSLIDVTLLAPTTLGRSLATQLESIEHSADQTSPRPTTLIANAALLRELKQKSPESFAAVQKLYADGKIDIAGGLDIDRPHPLMSSDAVCRDLARGRKAYQALEVQPPNVFSRLSYGLLPDSASVLRRSGFHGVFLNAWMEGSYPEGSQAKTSWEGADGTFLPTLTAPVIDASDPASFLAFGWLVGESLDHQHVPTVVLAHWPNRTCEYYELLRLSISRTPALGQQTLATEYFKETDEPYHQERLSGALFKYNWLANSDNPGDLIHRTKAYHRLHSRVRSLQNLVNLSWQLENFSKSSSVAEPDAASGEESSSEGDDKKTVSSALPVSDYSPELEQIQTLADQLFDQVGDWSAIAKTADELLESYADAVTAKLAKQLNTGRKQAQTASDHGRFLINPRSSATREQVHTNTKEFLDSSADWNYAAGNADLDQVTCVDLPSMGFVFAPVLSNAQSTVAKSSPLAQGGGVLQNEFLEAQVDSSRGHLRSLHVPQRRGNRLSVMIAHRERTPKGGFAYSEMKATDVRMITSSNVCGVVRSSGELEKDNRRIGKFEIDYLVWRGSRVLDISIRLSELKVWEEKNPWRSAYTLRIAWPTESALLKTFSCGVRHSWSGGQTVSPELIEIDETDYRTHYLTGGLAFHRRTEERFLETILACGNQTEVEHRVGIGVDLKAPLNDAARFMDRKYQADISGGIHSASGWLASVDVRTVSVDFEAPLVDAEGKCVGLRLFVNETSGKSMAARIRLPREVAAAYRVDYLGGHINQLSTDEDRITIALRANEQVSIDVIWK